MTFDALQAMLDVVRTARCLTVMGHKDGLPVVGLVGWDQLQEAVRRLEQQK
jgi:hypothetical protein